ncbi:hypothetical protein [Thermogymnomonas acidicola]|uniref:hypothetical protein n=1 Tax=Thermogymnomonas acidicola TaxID=399579 RepID=UPI0009467B56|nr:hypothetical protein [Thermogymnomonas acidicola]
MTAGSTTIEMQRRSSGRFEILRSGVPVGGYEERGLRIVYEGQVYEPESRRALVHFVNGSENRLVIMSMGMEAVVVERSQDSISATSDLNPDVALVCLGMLAPYSRPAVAQAVTTYSPYSRRRAYYRLSLVSGQLRYWYPFSGSCCSEGCSTSTCPYLTM